jgi:hypothetical protein
MTFDSVASRVAERYKAAALEVGYGTERRDLTTQEDFPVTTACVKCGTSSRLAMTIREPSGEDRYVCHVFENGQNSAFWLHDAAAFAIYLCPDIDCATATCLWNQA